jgi:gamma-glutamylcyclotransferase (GGCT)/AIG2-like uncharacterized protein YtfP
MSNFLGPGLRDPARVLGGHETGVRSVTQRLFIYGTLAPGRPNAHVLADIPGNWQPATVTGKLIQQGWGATLGYPGIVLDDGTDIVEGFVFSSDALEAHWARLDEFEGAGYERVLTSAKLEGGTDVPAYIYALRRDGSPGTAT